VKLIHFFIKFDFLECIHFINHYNKMTEYNNNICKLCTLGRYEELLKINERDIIEAVKNNFDNTFVISCKSKDSRVAKLLIKICKTIKEKPEKQKENPITNEKNIEKYFEILIDGQKIEIINKLIYCSTIANKLLSKEYLNYIIIYGKLKLISYTFKNNDEINESLKYMLEFCVINNKKEILSYILYQNDNKINIPSSLVKKLMKKTDNILIKNLLNHYNNSKQISNNNTQINNNNTQINNNNTQINNSNIDNIINNICSLYIVRSSNIQEKDNLSTLNSIVDTKTKNSIKKIISELNNEKLKKLYNRIYDDEKFELVKKDVIVPNKEYNFIQLQYNKMMIEACIIGNYLLLKNILELNYANIYYKNNLALFVVCYKGYPELLKLLIKENIKTGIFPFVTSRNNSSLLIAYSMALKYKDNNVYYEIMKILIIYGADFNMDDTYLIHNACIEGDIKMVKLLIDFLIINLDRNGKERLEYIDEDTIIIDTKKKSRTYNKEAYELALTQVHSDPENKIQDIITNSINQMENRYMVIINTFNPYYKKIKNEQIGLVYDNVEQKRREVEEMFNELNEDMKCLVARELSRLILCRNDVELFEILYDRNSNFRNYTFSNKNLREGFVNICCDPRCYEMVEYFIDNEIVTNEDNLYDIALNEACYNNNDLYEFLNECDSGEEELKNDEDWFLEKLLIKYDDENMKIIMKLFNSGAKINEKTLEYIVRSSELLRCDYIMDKIEKYICLITDINLIEQALINSIFNEYWCYKLIELILKIGLKIDFRNYSILRKFEKLNRYPCYMSKYITIVEEYLQKVKNLRLLEDPFWVKIH